MKLAEQFAKDKQGRRYADVLEIKLFQSMLNFFSVPDRQRRMVESELHHDRPALAGVIRELENQEGVDDFFGTNPGHVTTRFRQAIGVIVRIIMEGKGWRKTGRKGSLGVRTKAKMIDGTLLGATANTGGMSVWFTRAERYEPTTGTPFPSLEEKLKDIRVIYSELNFD